MLPRTIKDIRRKLKLTQGELAKVVKCSRYTVESWEQGIRKPGELYEERLTKLKRVADSVDKGTDVK